MNGTMSPAPPKSPTLSPITKSAGNVPRPAVSCCATEGACFAVSSCPHCQLAFLHCKLRQSALLIDLQSSEQLRAFSWLCSSLRLILLVTAISCCSSASPTRWTATPLASSQAVASSAPGQSSLRALVRLDKSTAVLLHCIQTGVKLVAAARRLARCPRHRSRRKKRINPPTTRRCAPSPSSSLLM